MVRYGGWWERNSTRDEVEEEPKAPRPAPEEHAASSAQPG